MWPNVTRFSREAQRRGVRCKRWLGRIRSPKNHQPWDHIDHIVGTDGMLPVTPGKNGCHGYAVEESRYQDSFERKAMPHAEGNPAKETVATTATAGRERNAGRRRK